MNNILLLCIKYKKLQAPRKVVELHQPRWVNYIMQLQIFYSVYVSKIMKSGW